MMEQITQGNRVRRHSRSSINRRVDDGIRESIAWHAEHPEHIQQRLQDLDDEWDIERSLEANAATLALTGSVLAMTVDKRFAILPIAVTAFLLQHAVQGWCPPLPIMRSLGVRTRGEIDREKFALKALRGDFERVGRTEAHSTRGQHELLAAIDRE